MTRTERGSQFERRLLAPLRRFRALVWDFFPPSERTRLAVFVSAATLAALVEVGGVVSIMPFMAIAAHPELLETNHIIVEFSRLTGIVGQRNMLILIGCGTLASLIVANSIAAGMLWAAQHFAARTNRRISASLMEQYLERPYAYHLQHHSAALTTRLLDDVDIAVDYGMTSALRLMTRSFAAFAILATLALINWRVAAAVMFAFGVPYILIFKSLRRIQSREGELAAEVAEVKFAIASEAFGGIKDLKVLGREAMSLNRFAKACRISARARSRSLTLSSMPRFAMETLGFGSLIVVLLVCLLQNRLLVDVLPWLTLGAVASARLLPALQEVFGCFMHLRFTAPVIQRVHRDLKPEILDRAGIQDTQGEGRDLDTETLQFEKEIRLESVSFSFDRTATVLDHVNMTIGRHECIGLVGPTGAGKTTLMDILLGLLEPTAGAIKIDGIRLSPARLRQWRRMVGYVPQQIFLANTSLRENIAFGIENDMIDVLAVERAARLAQIHDFVGTLPKGYDTEAGERGVRLSGGQRQRIGIARALYHDPDVLVFDEATSALDGATEDGVMEAIRSLTGRKTIIIIAHRLRTIRECTRIVLLDQGQVRDEGSFEELMARNESFRRMARERGAYEITRVGNA